MANPLRINNGEDFPPLGCDEQRNPVNKNKQQQQASNDKIIISSHDSSDDLSVRMSSLSRSKRNSRRVIENDHANHLPKSGSYGETLVSYRVGSRLCDYRPDLREQLNKRYVGKWSDFILVPIAPIRPTLYEVDSFEAAPDLILHPDDWNLRVAIDLGRPNLDHFQPAIARQFDKLFRHALYLGSPVIVISCPDSDLARATCASITNDRLRNIHLGPLILFRVSMDCRQYYSAPSSWCSSSLSSDTTGVKNYTNGHSEESVSPRSDFESSLSSTTSSSSLLLSGVDDDKPLIEIESRVEQQRQIENHCPWRIWNSLRGHLVPDKKIGVCLSIRDDLSGSQEELNRWMGEPVRMITISVDQFVRSPGTDSSLRLTSKCREFITKTMLANSFKTGLVIEAPGEQDLAEHMQYLADLIEQTALAHQDPIRSWNDKLQPPLQPLSSNLDSGVYACFEMDTKKYLKYRDAMIEALDRLLLRNQPQGEECQTFVLMVLGAGRGPLVDSFIDAIRAINSKHKFKIYALDKNPSSIRSLKYKQKNEWKDEGADRFETEVIESDMREWKPANQLKADIIATELLGSLADNELSPECIDGVWTISTPKTISIPQEYSSYLAPISSFKLFQELKRVREYDPTVFDQIYVAKLANHYLIGQPQQLFTFQHKDLSIPPERRKSNERFKKLTFWSKTETVCHGFAGYFSAHLFGTTHISTLEGQSTANMNSWFPAFIPLEEPIQLCKNTQLEVLFWRKETQLSVWYEWTIVKPVRSRIYSQSGFNTSMSKFIE